MKKGMLILAGGGDLKASFAVDARYFSLLRSSAQILYVPVALRRQAIGYEACYDWFSQLVASHAGEKEIDFTMQLEGDSLPDLNLYDSIYLGGGNTYKLLNFLWKSGLGEKISQFFGRGGVVYGGSAGAMVLGKDIRTVVEENDQNYSYFKGFDLLDGKSVYCHFNSTLSEKVSGLSRLLDTQIIAIPEDGGVFLDGDAVETIGEVLLFSGNEQQRM